MTVHSVGTFVSLSDILSAHEITGGQNLKEIGSQARVDIEDMFGKKVYLELYCKTIPKWRDKEAHLKDLGFSKTDE